MYNCLWFLDPVTLQSFWRFLIIDKKFQHSTFCTWQDCVAQPSLRIPHYFLHRLLYHKRIWKYIHIIHYEFQALFECTFFENPNSSTWIFHCIHAFVWWSNFLRAWLITHLTEIINVSSGHGASSNPLDPIICVLILIWTSVKARLPCFLVGIRFLEQTISLRSIKKMWRRFRKRLIE